MYTLRDFLCTRAGVGEETRLAHVDTTRPAFAVARSASVKDSVVTVLLRDQVKGLGNSFCPSLGLSGHSGVVLGTSTWRATRPKGRMRLCPGKRLKSLRVHGEYPVE